LEVFRRALLAAQLRPAEFHDLPSELEQVIILVGR
jgi:hypothetical protein